VKEQGILMAANMMEMRKRLEEMTELVQPNVRKARHQQKSHYDCGTLHRELRVGEKVLVLLPDARNHLKPLWVGLYEVK